MENQYAYSLEGERPEFIPFRVSRLGSEYDLSGFWEYPARTGWLVHRYDLRCHKGRCPPRVCIATDTGQSNPYGLCAPAVSRKTDPEATVSKKLEFLQTWLFYGALAEAHTICSLPVNRDDYSANAFHTARFNGLPIKLYMASQISGRAGNSVLKEKLHALIRQVQLMITRASDWEDEHKYTLAQCEVLFSIQILLRILSLTLLYFSRQPFLDSEDELNISIADPVADWKPEGQLSMIKFTYDRLLHGWCKTYQTDESSYRTLHVNESCECAFAFVNPIELCDVLARNAVPKIVVSEDMGLSVVDGNEGFTYTAFGHVWADGLGNPFETGLPTCQIRRLRDSAVQLCSRFGLDNDNTKVALWIDSICIPVDPEMKEYRKLAIRLLAQTYTEAMAVLVLDRELCRFESRGASNLEACIRVICSGWLKRLWTLQEASLTWDSHVEGTGTLFIQMADGPAHWNRRTRCFEYRPSHFCPPPPKPSALAVSVQEVKTDLVYGMHLLTAMDDLLPSGHDIQEPRFDTRLQRIIGAVQNRSTSKAEDEPVCMASLLGLSLPEILDARHVDERMVKIYQLLEEIATAILFADFGVPNFLSHNIAMAPFRWAPRSLSSLERPMEINNAFAAMRFADPPLPLFGRVCADGLHIQHHGFVFDIDKGPITITDKSILIDTGNVETYSLSLALLNGSPHSIGPIKRCALLFKDDLCSDVVIIEIESEMALESGTRLYVAIAGHGTVRPGPTKELFDGGKRGNITTLRGFCTQRGQLWCVT